MGSATDTTKALTLTVLDTAESIHLGWKPSSNAMIEIPSQMLSDTAARWSSRPFIFSAALSIEIAALCVNILAVRLVFSLLSLSLLLLLLLMMLLFPLVHP